MSLSSFANELNNLSEDQLRALLDQQLHEIDCDSEPVADSETATEHVDRSSVQPDNTRLNGQNAIGSASAASMSEQNQLSVQGK